MDLPLPLRVTAERGIEALLRLDPETRERLSALDGKVIAIHVTSPELNVVMSIVDKHIHFIGVIDTPADTTLTGTLSALRSMSAGNDALYRGEVTVGGDIGTGQLLREIIAELDPDWEGFLSPLIGDSLVHRAGVAGGLLSGWIKRTQEAMSQNTGEYLQEEVQLLAPNSEVTAYCTDVDDIRASVDRLEARVQQLEKTGRRNPGGNG